MKNKTNNKLVWLGILLWPFGIVRDLLVSKRSRAKKIFLGIPAIIFYLVLWIVLVVTLVVNVPKALFEWGWVDKPTTFSTTGPSMLPTLKEEDSVVLVSPKRHGLERGDIVTFGNVETEGASYIKRIVGLPGEKISLKQGAVWIDGKPLLEPYTNEGRPTFGNTFLTECEEKEIPTDSFAVMGDNRALSWDSRAIGFVSRGEITGVRKEAQSTQFETEENILKKYTPVPFDSLKAVQEMNKLRSEGRTQSLLTNKVIVEAAQARAEEIRDNFDSWKSGGNIVDETLTRIGYRSNLTHEYVTFGYLTEKEAVDQAVQTPDQKNALMSDKFTEAGVGVAMRSVGSCSYPIVVTVLAWPSVPTYDEKTVSWWKGEGVILTKNIQNFQTWVGDPATNQVKLKELINTAAQMVIISERVAKKMENREWLTTEDYRTIKIYDELLTRHNRLNDELWPETNVRGYSSEPLEVSW